MTEPKNFKYLGKDYKYKSVKGLSKQLKLTPVETKKLLEKSKRGTMFAYLVDKQGNVARQNLKIKPLVAREFGLKRVNNKTIIKDKFKNYKGITISSSLNKSTPLNFNFRVISEINWSGDTYDSRTFQVNEKVAIKNINKNFILELIKKHYLLNEQDVKNVDFEILSEKTEQKFTLDFMGLRRAKPLNITNMYNELITNKDGKCIQDYLGNIYKKFSKKEISKLKNINDIYNYCFKYNIKMIAYDINGKVIKSNYPTKKNSNRKNLVFIAYDSHLYPIKNQLLKKKKILDDCEIVHHKNLKDKLIEFLEDGILPANISYHSGKFQSFIVDDKIYLDNPDYEECKNILKELGLLDHLKINTNFLNISKILEKLFIKENVDSFIPNNSIFVKGGFNYHNNKLEYSDDFITIDKNKSYPHALQSLDYLLITDYKTYDIKTKDIKKIIPHYLYIVEPEKSTILLPDENVYTGSHLIYCKSEGIKFNVKEELECKKVFNYYKELVETLFKISPKNAKNILNPLIGKMEQYDSDYKLCKFDKILGLDEYETYQGFTERLNDNYYVGLKEKTVNNILNKKPISIQIKDKSRVVIYEMMKKLKIDDKKELLQIKTDSITFKPKNEDYKKYLNKKLSGWKLETYKPITDKEPYKTKHSFIFTASDDDDSFLGEQLAGGGKTYTIMNEIVPSLDKSYIILSPSHVSISEYRNKNYNCDVIQKYLYKKEIPDVDTIILDEIGMIGNAGWNLLYTAKLLGKRIIAYGDFKQLKPVKSERLFNKEHWLNLMFGKINREWTNRRNTFTEKYYMDLFNNNIDIRKEVKKYSTNKPEEGDFVLCYFNDTREKYNRLMCEKKGIKSLIDTGARIMCKTNDLRDIEIYNNYIFEVVSHDNEMVELYNVDFKNYIRLSKEEIEKNFIYAYARTLYNIQGQTINSYYWCEEDNRALDGRSSYTIISRLRN